MFNDAVTVVRLKRESYVLKIVSTMVVTAWKKIFSKKV